MLALEEEYGGPAQVLLQFLSISTTYPCFVRCLMDKLRLYHFYPSERSNVISADILAPSFSSIVQSSANPKLNIASVIY
jgi:hypothetical protein